MFRYLVIGLLVFLTGCNAEKIDEFDNVDEFEHVLTDGSKSTFTSPSLLTNYDSCDQIRNQLRDRVIKKNEEAIASWPVEAPHYLPPITCGAAPNEAARAGGEGVDYSGTNNQEVGIDEADVIKIDGRFFYVVNADHVDILSIETEGRLEPVSRVSFEYDVEKILLIDSRLFAFSSFNTNVRQIRIDEIELGEDRRNPALEKSYYFKGSLSGARKIGNKIHFASYAYDEFDLITWPDLPHTYYEQSDEEQDRLWAEAKANAIRQNAETIANYDFLRLVPSQTERVNDEFVDIPLTEFDCQRSYMFNGADGGGFTSLVSLNPESDTLSTQRVRTNSTTVYASPGQIILATDNHVWSSTENSLQQQLVIHRFNIDANYESNYGGSVALPGELHNSFSISEYNGYTRVATTIRRDWQDEESQDSNSLFILGEDVGGFGVISSLENLAEGETIWSARFTKDKGFLVTFEQTDPLFTLDLSDPKHPRVAGELKIPGVSTYLQDIGNGHLLAVGYSGNDQGLDFRTAVSLFDVSNFAEPRLHNTLSLAPIDNNDGSWERSDSEANHNHLAVNYFAPVGLTAIPVLAYRYVNNDDGFPDDEDGEHGYYEYISKLKIINTKIGQDLSIVGEVDHSNFYNSNQSGYWDDAQVHRSYFVGNYLFAFSSKGITATRLSDMITTGSYKIE